MRKKQKETDISGDEKKDDTDGDEKKPLSPARDDSPPQQLEPAPRPPGYSSYSLLPCMFSVSVII